MTDSEEYEKLKSNILSLNMERTIQTIIVASPVNGEGCSTVASNLALSLAKNKALKVILIDGNIRNPNLHERFNLELHKGLSEVIIGRFGVSDVLKKTMFPNLSVITCGDVGLNPTETFEAHRVKTLIIKLKEEFDYLIFDSPPVNAYPDAHILASLMDGVILVIHACKTRWEVAEKAKEYLEKVHANILGVVLNRKRYYIPDFIYKRL